MTWPVTNFSAEGNTYLMLGATPSMDALDPGLLNIQYVIDIDIPIIRHAIES